MLKVTTTNHPTSRQMWERHRSMGRNIRDTDRQTSSQCVSFYLPPACCYNDACHILDFVTCLPTLLAELERRSNEAAYGRTDALESSRWMLLRSSQKCWNLEDVKACLHAYLLHPSSLFLNGLEFLGNGERASERGGNVQATKKERTRSILWRHRYLKGEERKAKPRLLSLSLSLSL